MGFVGISSAQYGTFTVGRQNTLVLDQLAVYDPMSLSYAFSLIGWSGGAGAGTGATETSRWDNSARYAITYGPVHAAVQYSQGGQDTAIFGEAYAGNAGITWKGFSVDGTYTHDRGAVLVNAFQFTRNGPLAPPTCGTATTQGCDTLQLGASLADIDAFTITGKYTFEFTGLGGFMGGYKDAGYGGYKDSPQLAPWKFTIYGGYEHSDLSNTTAAGNVGDTTIGGYRLGFVNNFPYATTRTLETSWVGGKLELPTNWSFTAAYYRLDHALS